MLALAACGGGSANNEAAPAASQRISPGQWELTSEVTAFQALDQGPPKIQATVGAHATQNVCVGAGPPPTALFSGEDYQCRTDNYYVHGGILNVTMLCRRETPLGSAMMTAVGTFENSSLAFDRDLTTTFGTGGDVRITTHVTGRRTGDCTPDASGSEHNQSEGQGG